VQTLLILVGFDVCGTILLDDSGWNKPVDSIATKLHNATFF
jgi:hypothetical protein